MAAIITSKFRFHNAEQFKESFSEAAPTNYYLFIGRPGPFASSGTTPETLTGGSDAAPPTPIDQRKAEAYHWDDMLAAKKIDSTGVSHAIPRRDLDISGSTIYDMYKPDYSASKTATSGATNLFDSKFYFMTSAYRVYKVLDNNIAGLSTPTAWGSTEGTPTTTTANPVIAGNYMIKYMYTLSTTDVQNFLTPDFQPAPAVAEGSSALVDGQLNVVTVTSPGAMTPVPSADTKVYNVPIRGDGIGGFCTVTIGGSGGSYGGQVRVASGRAVEVTGVGSGYTHGTIYASDIKEQWDRQNSTVLSWGTNDANAPVFDVIIGPDGGHGSNPAKELGGNFVMMDVKLQQTETFDFSVVNDFRQVGIVRNPNSYGTSSAYASTSARQTYAIKLTNGTSGTFKVDEKISQNLADFTNIDSSGMSISGSTITVTTPSAHGYKTGQMVTITGGSWSAAASGSVAAANPTTGHRGTHHITVASTTSFTYTIGTSSTPSGTFTGPFTVTAMNPQGIVVEYDAGNQVLFYVQTPYTNQGTDAKGDKQPFSGNAQITGAESTATGTPDTAYSSALNNTSFTAGYANPEMQPDSGDVIYIENRKPISRASDQTEDIKLIVEF